MELLGIVLLLHFIVGELSSLQYPSKKIVCWQLLTEWSINCYYCDDFYHKDKWNSKSKV